MPVSSVCEEDIDGFIENSLSKDHHNESAFHYMCTAVLDLYMPCNQLSLEKKNLMIETMACNQSLSKDFRKEIIEKYIQDPRLAEELLYIVDQDLSDKRFKKTKLAARDEEQS